MQAANIVYAGVFRRGWPYAPQRFLRLRVSGAEKFVGDVVDFDRLIGTRMPILRFGTAMANQRVTRAIGAMALGVGEAVDGVTKARSAAEVVTELTKGAEMMLP
ncbi:hypothetical protein [Belnapia sp. F-4-1]|uniref:hypothetical protein n=1 Tax=Belnapia sp. F-4-1 TaxID=1545443 RepID=UPI0005B93CB0|nr:hypothetical protein [Belnapia sp. F-4-1]